MAYPNECTHSTNIFYFDVFFFSSFDSVTKCSFIEESQLLLPNPLEETENDERTEKQNKTKQKRLSKFRTSILPTVDNIPSFSLASGPSGRHTVIIVDEGCL